MCSLSTQIDTQMASKNDFLSNYREWVFKLLICDVPSTDPKPSPRQESERRTICRKRKRSISLLTISILSIFIGKRGSASIFPLFYFYYFRMPQLSARVEKFAQMCKKLNSHRTVTARSERDRDSEVWKIISFSSSNEERDFNGNFHQKSSAKCVRARWCDNGRVNDYKWIWRLPSIIFKDFFALWPFSFVRWHCQRLSAMKRQGFQIPLEDSAERIFLSFISTYVAFDSSRADGRH